MYNNNMTTIDKFLLHLLDNNPNISRMPPRDLKVLKSLAKIINSSIFITENQGKLLVKILKENKDIIDNNILDVLDIPMWSKPFRVVDRTKKMFIGYDNRDMSVIVIEFTYSAVIRKALFELSKKISGFVQHANGKLLYADLTEKNIILLVNLLSKYDFDIDDKIQNFYEIISAWSETDIKNQFLLTNIVHQNFQKTITADLGIETPIDDNIISDRSIRYQYFHEKTGKIPENLLENIAYRKTSKIWIDKNNVELPDVIECLLKLKRLPILVVFDNNDHKKCLNDLQNLSKSLNDNGIDQNVGIYFRLPNDEIGKQFNTFISDNQYNSVLDTNTKIVGVQSGKIPKFFLKTAWKPMSVISIGNSLRQTKTAVYANNCDLIISYTDTQPIIESRTSWE